MADTTFVDNTTVIEAEWLNAVNDFYYTLFSGAGTAADARTALGLGTISTQDADSVAITGGNITGVTGVQEDVITTQGDIVRGSSGNAAERLALGTAGQVLESDGTDVAWATRDWWTHVVTHTASSDTEVAFTDLDQSSDHKFVFHNLVPVTDGAHLHTQVSDDAGASPTYDSGAVYSWLMNKGTTGGIGYRDGGEGNAEARIVDQVGSGAGETGVSGEMTLFDPGDSSSETKMLGKVMYQPDTGTNAYQLSESAVVYLTAAAVQAIRFYYSTGNVESGTITHYTRPVQ